MSEKFYQLALVLTEGVGAVLAKQLFSYCGSAEGVFKASKANLAKIPQIGEKTARKIIEKASFKQAEIEFEKAEKANVQLIFYTENAYPQRLRNIHDAPSLLYYTGNADLNAPRMVGIVGTRQATEYGKEITRRLVTELGQWNVTIVSGLAYGIDIQAHKEAVKQNIPTIGVMATGIEILYPPTHHSTAQEMKKNGGLLTEYPFGSKPDARHFPERNRIVAGMCDAIIVIETARKGGSMITAEIANSYDREVFAVPNSLNVPTAEGCHYLIKSHQARLMTEALDLVKMMNWDLDNQEKIVPKTPQLFDDSSLSEGERIIFKLLLQGKPVHLDELGWQSGLGISRTASTLLEMEFKGMVRSLPGKLFSLQK